MKEQKTAFIFIYKLTPIGTITISTLHSTKESAVETIRCLGNVTGIEVLSKPQKITYTINVNDDKVLLQRIQETVTARRENEETA